MKPIRVLLVDDHEILRDSLFVFFETYDDFELVGEAANGIEAVEVCSEIRPDVVLMDLIMPEMDGTSAIRIIRQQFPEIHIIALTSFSSRELIQAAMRAGASGYLLKNVSIDTLADAIRAAHEGQTVFSPEIDQKLNNPSDNDND
jgi:NarL family two-component system response regulator LiaR